MESSQNRSNRVRKTRAKRVRKWVRGSSEKPRLCVVKSNRNIFVQLIDDEQSKTLIGISTLSKSFQNTEFNKKNKNSGRQLGLTIAQLAKETGIEKVVFDRGPFKYHGVLAAVADGAREGGLDF